MVGVFKEIHIYVNGSVEKFRHIAVLLVEIRSIGNDILFVTIKLYMITKAKERYIISQTIWYMS
jgi:hypothetical protein